MNKREKLLNKNKTLDNIKRMSLMRTSCGNAKCWKGTTYEHFMTIAAIVWKLTKQDYEVYTEVEFINGGRADIFVIDQNGDGMIVEVLHTESDERFNAKLSSYPFPVYKVRTADFDVDSWEL